MEKPSWLKLMAGLTLGVTAVSLGSILVRFSQEAPSLVIAFCRMLWATAILTPFYWLGVGKIRKGDWGWRVLAGLALALHFAFWIASLRYTSVAVSVLLVNTAPIFVALIGRLTLTETLSRTGWAGLATALCGGILLTRQELANAGSGWGALLAIAGAFMLGLYLLCGRRIRRHISLIEYVYPTYLLAAVILGLMVAGAGLDFAGYSPKTFLFLILLGLVPQCIGHTSYNWALGFLPATLISILILAEPFLATLFAWWLLSELVTPIIASGGILIGAGIYIVARYGGLK